MGKIVALKSQNFCPYVQAQSALEQNARITAKTMESVSMENVCAWQVSLALTAVKVRDTE